ncbi:MAG: Ig-like domain-containing protein, partial [Deltaproteobacteria bacterium]
VDTTAPTLTITAPAQGSTTSNLPAIRGMSEPNATVHLTIDGGAIVTVMADASGNWTYTPTTPLAPGQHTVVATTVDAAGNGASARDGFNVASGTPCTSDANCGGTTPVCDLPTQVCRGCATNPECPLATPVCLPTGACVQCSATSTAACPGATPVCNAMNRCVECTGADRSRCAASGTGASCLPGDVCGCGSDSDCSADRRCNLTAHRCEPRMMVDAGVDAGTDAGSDIGPDAHRFITGAGACACRTAGTGRPSGSPLALLGLAAAAGLVARRRRRRD